jgi:hypothetical protein
MTRISTILLFALLLVMTGALLAVKNLLFLHVTIENKSLTLMQDVTLVFPNGKTLNYGAIGIGETSTLSIWDETGEGAVWLNMNGKEHTIDSYVTSSNEDFTIEIRTSGPVIK